jgi:proteasome lid subunit RPN8/RPN11
MDMPLRIYEVFMYETPFSIMIVSAVEVFAKECLGLLLGTRAWHSLDRTRRAIVEQVVPFQTAERERDQVSIEKKPEFRCRNMFYKLGPLEPLGNFHSHPDAQPILSEADKECMEIGDIEVVVGISKKRKSVPWSYNIRKKELSGVLGDFRFDIATYVCFKSPVGSREFQRINLVCPFALGIGSKYFDLDQRTFPSR